MKYYRILKLFSGRSRRQNLSNIAPEEEFRKVLEQERARADRYDQGFSLVAFELGEKDNGLPGRMAQTLKNRLRSIDYIGWLNGKIMGVVLPHTPAKGAETFAEKIIKQVTDKEFPLSFQVFTYPSHWIDKGSGSPPQSGKIKPLKTSNKGKGEEFTNFIEEVKPFFGYRMPRWKRLTDIVGASFALLLCLPVFLAISLYIKIVSPGPIFFKQKRLGYMGRTFTFWKFRTMKVDVNHSMHQEHLSNLINEEMPMTKLDDSADPRIIPCGRILRSSGLDELPQLFHVIMGDMTLIGPRPSIPYEAKEFKDWQSKRFDGVPGLTGLWQVNGKNKTTFNEMIRLDIRYLMGRSFWIDLKILFKTLPAIIIQITEIFINAKENKNGEEKSSSRRLRILGTKSDQEL